MKKLMPITNKKVCMKCLKEKESVKHYHLYERGYGSDFDGLSSIIQVCDECKPESLEEWLNENPSFPFGDNITEDYQYEDEIQDFMVKLPLEGRELFWNHYAKGFSANMKDRDDFLAIESGTASDEIYKKYNMLTPNEMKMSKKRYPTCANVIDVIYSDNSRGNRCILHNILSNINSKSNCYNTKCNTCKDYKKLNEGEERFIITMQNLETKEECLKRKYREELNNDIHNLSSTKVEMGKWIPCSIQQPLEEGVYFTSVYEGDGFSTTHYAYSGGEWRMILGTLYYSIVTHRVIAWMPLPEPYQGEKG